MDHRFSSSYTRVKNLIRFLLRTRYLSTNAYEELEIRAARTDGKELRKQNWLRASVEAAKNKRLELAWTRWKEVITASLSRHYTGQPKAVKKAGDQGIPGKGSGERHVDGGLQMKEAAEDRDESSVALCCSDSDNA